MTDQLSPADRLSATDRLTPESYDELPYPGLSYAQTHPDTMATLATLLGLEPAPVTRCRVLDIGCAVGGNIIPMAYTLPASEFVGIDYAGRQIEIGRGYVAELGLDNVRLEQIDVMDVPEELGQFDYIIAHGFYSWVPVQVRDRLLAVIRRHLAPNGVAYVSYNVYPGWHMLNVVRDVMFYHARGLDGLKYQAAAGREIINFLADTVPEDAGTLGVFLHTYRTMLTDKLAEGEDGGDSLLMHDEMGPINDPMYFEEFIGHAAEHELQYLSEVDLSLVMPTRLAPEVTKRLAELAGDPMKAEQYLDFIYFRTFRRTLLCHQEATVVRRLRPQVVTRFRLASTAVPASEEPDLSPGVVEEFHGDNGAIFKTDHPLSKAAFMHLNERRSVAIPFGELARAAAARIGLTLDETAEGEVATLAANALRALTYSSSLMEFHVYQPPFSLTVSERPRTTPVIRWQAKRGMKATNLRYERVELDALTRALMSLLDGEHDQEQLLAVMMKWYKQKKIKLTKEMLAKAGPEEILGKQLRKGLGFMAKAALLES